MERCSCWRRGGRTLGLGHVAKITAVVAVAWGCSLSAAPARAASPCVATTPANITMSPLSPGVITADGTSQASAVVTLTDISGNPVVGDASCLQLSASDSGMGFGPIIDDGNGTYTASVVSSTVAHQVTVTVTETTTSPGISASEPLTLVHGPAAGVTVTLNPAVVIANGLSTTQAIAAVSDAYGNPIVGDALLFSASNPGIRFGAVSDHGNGTYSAIVHSSNAAGSATVSVTDISASGALSGTANLTLMPAPSLVSLVTMQWTFFYSPTYTVARALIVNGAPKAAVINVSCSGRGCPFSGLSLKVRKQPRCPARSRRACQSGSRLVLTSGVTGRRLHPGARITVTIMRRGWIGKYYSFRMRPATGPAIQINCLAPGSTRPGANC